MRIIELIASDIESLSSYYTHFRVYRAATEDGTYSLLGSVALVSTKIIYTYVDNDGLDTDFYKYTYYKSTATTAETTQYSLPLYYASVSRLISRLNETAGTASTDVHFVDAMEAATDVVSRYCKRWFSQKVETRYYEGPTPKGQYTGKGLQKLFIDDCVNLSNIVLDFTGGQSGASTSTLTLNTHCYLWPQDAPNSYEPYNALAFIPTATLPSTAAYIDNYVDIYWPTGYRAIRLTGTWGWPTNPTTHTPVPGSVKEATLELACRIYKGRDNAYSRQVGSSEIGSMTIIDDLANRDVKLLLENYRKGQGF